MFDLPEPGNLDSSLRLPSQDDSSRSKAALAAEVGECGAPSAATDEFIFRFRFAFDFVAIGIGKSGSGCVNLAIEHTSLAFRLSTGYTHWHCSDTDT